MIKTDDSGYYPIDEYYQIVQDNISQLKAYPNPFNPTITFDINNYTAENTQLKIFNLKGQFIEELTIEKQATWDASAYSSGIYFVNLVQDNKLIETKKILYLK